MKPKPIKDVIKSWRERKEFTQQKAAFVLNISISSLQKWETGTLPHSFAEKFIRRKCK